MPTLNLKNITTKQKEDRNFNTYYLIVNNDIIRMRLISVLKKPLKMADRIW